MRKFINTEAGDFMVAGDVWLPLKFTAETMEYADKENFALGIPAIAKWIQKFFPKGEKVAIDGQSFMVDQIVTTEQTTAYYYQNEIVTLNLEDNGW